MSESEKKPGADVVLVVGRTEDGAGARVVRAREDRLEAGEVRPMKEGASIQGGEVVRLTPRSENAALFDVEVQYDARSGAQHAGPARVTSRAYRSNYDEIFSQGEAGEDDPQLN